MSPEIIGGILRALLPALLGYLGGAGWIPGDEVGAITAGVVAAGAAGWSAYTNTKLQLIKKVAAMSDVEKVVAAPSIADGSLAENSKVTSR